MEVKDVKIAGAVVFWRTDVTSRRKLIEGLRDLGYDDSFMPEPRTPAAALKAALSDCFGEPTTMIRPLDKKGGFAVVDEVRGEGENEYETRCNAKVEVDDDTGAVVELLIGGDIKPEEEADVRTAFAKKSGELAGTSVSAMLVKIAADKFMGTTLRPSGGIYWIPGDKIADWAKLARVVEDAAVIDAVVDASGVKATKKGGNAVYLLRTPVDEDTVRAIKDAITEESLAEAARISQEISSGDLGEKALNSRVIQAKNLRSRLATYQSELGTLLGDVDNSLREVEVAAAKAAIQQAANSAKDGNGGAGMALKAA